MWNRRANRPVDEAVLPKDELRAELDEVVEFTYRGRQLSVQQNAAWQIMHGVLAYQREFLVERDGAGNARGGLSVGRWFHAGLGCGDRDRPASGAARLARCWSWAVRRARGTPTSGWRTWCRRA